MTKPKATNRKKLVAFALLICKADVPETAYPKSGEIRFDEIGLLHFFVKVSGGEFRKNRWTANVGS